MRKVDYDKLTSVIKLTKMLASLEQNLEDNQKIIVSNLYEDWAPGKHKVGDIYNAADQTWECYAEYDNAIYPDINPENGAWFTFNRPLHGTSEETARPFVKPTHSMDIYKAGEYMIWVDGSVMMCVLDTSFGPDEHPAAWQSLNSTESNVEESPQIAEWKQPDSTNPYMANDIVKHNNATWQTTIDNNVWEPGLYGWA